MQKCRPFDSGEGTRLGRDRGEFGILVDTAHPSVRGKRGERPFGLGFDRLWAPALENLGSLEWAPTADGSRRYFVLNLDAVRAAYVNGELNANLRQVAKNLPVGYRDVSDVLKFNPHKRRVAERSKLARLLALRPADLAKVDDPDGWLTRNLLVIMQGVITRKPFLRSPLS